jgi:hypothetical protein
LIKRLLGYFNLKFSLVSGVLMGLLIFSTQLYTVGEFYPALTASIKQFCFSFTMTAFLILIVESVVTAMQDYKYCAFYGFMAAWMCTSFLSAILHNLKGTENPVDAIIINVLAAPPGLIFMAFRKKRMLRRESGLVKSEV